MQLDELVFGSTASCLVQDHSCMKDRTSPLSGGHRISLEREGSPLSVYALKHLVSVAQEHNGYQFPLTEVARPELLGYGHCEIYSSHSARYLRGTSKKSEPDGASSLDHSWFGTWVVNFGPSSNEGFTVRSTCKRRYLAH